MGSTSKAGRICYGIAILVMGLLTVYYHDFPYMFLPPNHSQIPGIGVIAVISGILMVLVAGSILFEWKTRPVALVFGAALLLICCCYCVPFLFTSGGYLHFDQWENAEKELAIAAGALVMAGLYPAKDNNTLTRFLAKLIPAGAILYAITIICFGILHFMLAKEASVLIPAWIPGHLFWMYFCGAALIGAGVAIILQIKTGLFAALLGIMIFIWFVLLHIPRIIAAPAADIGDETASAFLALAYSGIAFAIAGTRKKIN